MYFKESELRKIYNENGREHLAAELAVRSSFDRDGSSSEPRRISNISFPNIFPLIAYSMGLLQIPTLPEIGFIAIVVRVVKSTGPICFVWSLLVNISLCLRFTVPIRGLSFNMKIHVASELGIWWIDKINKNNCRENGISK